MLSIMSETHDHRRYGGQIGRGVHRQPTGGDHRGGQNIDGESYKVLEGQKREIKGIENNAETLDE